MTSLGEATSEDNSHQWCGHWHIHRGPGVELSCGVARFALEPGRGAQPSVGTQGWTRHKNEGCPLRRFTSLCASECRVFSPRSPRGGQRRPILSQEAKSREPVMACGPMWESLQEPLQEAAGGARLPESEPRSAAARSRLLGVPAKAVCARTSACMGVWCILCTLPRCA